jgi:DNA invertase Pin-like site-specific DNA recombinase
MSRGERVIGYVRAGEGASRTEERAAIAAACKRPGWQLVRVEEDGAGGGKPGLPGLARALEALGAGEAEMLVVARLDRLVGSASEAARLLERAKRERWNLVALDLGLDLLTPAGRRVAKAFATVAEWERRLRSERTRAEGATLGTPRRAAAASVDKIGKLRAQGLSLQAIADELNRLRIPTARGGSKWRPSSVHSVLSRVS